MEVIRRLFGGLPVQREPTTLKARLDELVRLDIVGEASYQREIARFAARRKQPSDWLSAELVPEPNNPYDENAVAVRIDNVTVGYLARPIAKLYHSMMSGYGNGETGTTRGIAAEIRGGPRRDEPYAKFGVVLWVPPEMANKLGIASGIIVPGHSGEKVPGRGRTARVSDFITLNQGEASLICEIVGGQYMTADSRLTLLERLIDAVSDDWSDTSAFLLDYWSQATPIDTASLCARLSSLTGRQTQALTSAANRFWDADGWENNELGALIKVGLISQP